MAGEPEVELQGCAVSPGCVPEDAVSPTRSGVQLVVVMVMVVTNGGCRYRVWLHYAGTITITQGQDITHIHIQRLEAWLLFIHIHQLISS